MTTTEQRPQTASDDQSSSDPQDACVAAGPVLLVDQRGIEPLERHVDEGHLLRNGQVECDNQPSLAVAVPTSPGLAEVHTASTSGVPGPVTQAPEPTTLATTPSGPSSVRAHSSPAATVLPSPKATAPSGNPSSVTDHEGRDAHHAAAGDAPTSPGPAIDGSALRDDTPVLADPFLALAADVLDDLERVRIANENRLRQLTRTDEDSDGEERGFGLTLDHPDVARLASLVDSLAKAEHQAELNLGRQLRKHPLHPWLKAQKGVGDKQAARLLAAVGDPYWNDLHDRPRLVSELWSYCGYGDPQKQVRRKGQKANWSSAAKMRAFNVAESCLKQLVKPCHVIKTDDGAYGHAVHVDGCTCSAYRIAYDKGRAKYADSVHPYECDRCSPKGKPPAPVGSPRSPKHVHQAAIRLATKDFLRDLWREAARLHGHPAGQRTSASHRADAIGGP